MSISSSIISASTALLSSISQRVHSTYHPVLVTAIRAHELTNNVDAIKLQVKVVAQQHFDEGASRGKGKAEP